MSLYQIDSGRFRAGVVVRHGRVVKATSIIKYMQGWTYERMTEYCRNKGWKRTRCRS